MTTKPTGNLRQLCPEAQKLILPRPVKAFGNRVNILALGDVGTTLLLGLRLMGGGVIDSIGIFDKDDAVMRRCEMEMNQIGAPSMKFPEVEMTGEKDLFNCDVFLFCASRGIPDPGSAGGDVRMMQFDANREIVESYARMAGRENYRGIFGVVSDPVDPLCKAALLASDLEPAQIRGYGLGVMNMRAEYFAGKDSRFSSYLTEGRAFGPHGRDLVIANSIENYDDDLSKELTAMTVEANMKVRELGFKPYMAPAVSSAALPVLHTLLGMWNYSSIYFGKGGEGAFVGVRNRCVGENAEFEDVPLPEKLYERIEWAYRNLCDII